MKERISDVEGFDVVWNGAHRDRDDDLLSAPRFPKRAAPPITSRRGHPPRRCLAFRGRIEGRATMAAQTEWTRRKKGGRANRSLEKSHDKGL